MLKYHFSVAAWVMGVIMPVHLGFQCDSSGQLSVCRLSNWRITFLLIRQEAWHSWYGKQVSSTKVFTLCALVITTLMLGMGGGIVSKRLMTDKGGSVWIQYIKNTKKLSLLSFTTPLLSSSIARKLETARRFFCNWEYHNTCRKLLDTGTLE